MSQSTSIETSIDKAKGLYLTDILDIKGLETGNPFATGQFDLYFTVKDSFLFIADFPNTKNAFLTSLSLYKINLENTQQIQSTKVVDISKYKIPDLRDIKLINDSTFFLLSRFGVLKIKWGEADAEVLYWQPFNIDNFFPTKLQIISDTLLLLGSIEGSLYQSYETGKVLPSGYSLYQPTKNIFYNIIVKKIDGIMFTDINNHRFLTVVDSYVVYSNGVDYTLNLENAFDTELKDSVIHEINDPYWITASDSFINYLNSLSRYFHYSQIKKSYDSLSIRVSNINALLPIQDTVNKFIVFLEYGSRLLKHREYEKGTIDVYSIVNNKFRLINSDIEYPGNTKMTDTVNNRHHKLYIYDESCFSEKYAIFYQGELDDNEVRQMFLSKNGTHTLQQYYDLRKVKEAEGKQFKKFFYIYRYY